LKVTEAVPSDARDAFHETLTPFFSNQIDFTSDLEESPILDTVILSRVILSFVSRSTEARLMIPSFGTEIVLEESSDTETTKLPDLTTSSSLSSFASFLHAAGHSSEPNLHANSIAESLQSTLAHPSSLL
jgi:hypothetical protein